MADFTALKAEIQNYVKQNGNNAITGDGLQAILISMVQALGDSAINDLASSLSNEVLARQGADTTLQGNIDAANTAITTLATFIGNGYMFRGIATLETVPSALGGKVFYITATAGQYTNMGGITVSEGISILAYDGTSWSASLLIGIDATPTNGSNGLVRSGGVYTSLTQENARAMAAETASAEFNSTTKKLIFKNSAGTVLYEMDATPFIVDGMVDDVYISGGNLIISFNTDAGKQDISIPLTAIFNPANYYDKTAIDALLLPITTRLAAGYIYMGLATPSGTPDTSVGKVFYIATAAGTYTNFANTQVSEGITILKYDGTNWTKEQVLFLDGGVFDISAYNLSGDPLAPTKYADLEAALGTNGANIPAAIRKGGMSVKFVCSSDNKYVQYRLMADEWSTTESDWQGIDNVPTAGSHNLVESEGVFKAINSSVFSEIPDANMTVIKAMYLTGIDTSAIYKARIAIFGSYKVIQIFDNVGTADANVKALGEIHDSLFVTIIPYNSSGISGYAILDTVNVVNVAAADRATINNSKVVEMSQFISNTLKLVNLDSEVTEDSNKFITSGNIAKSLKKYSLIPNFGITQNNKANSRIKELYVDGDIDTTKYYYIYSCGYYNTSNTYQFYICVSDTAEITSTVVVAYYDSANAPKGIVKLISTQDYSNLTFYAVLDIKSTDSISDLRGTQINLSTITDIVLHPSIYNCVKTEEYPSAVGSNEDVPVNKVIDGYPDVKVIVTGTYVRIRTAYDDSRDIMFNCSLQNSNNVFAMSQVWVGANTLSDDDLAVAANLFHNAFDSNPPLPTLNYKFLGGNHGLYTLKITATGKTKADIGSIYQSANAQGSDVNYGKFKLVDVKDNGEMWLAPLIYEDDTRPYPYREWTVNNPVGTTFTWLSGGATSTDIEATSVVYNNNAQYFGTAKKTALILELDGNVITYGTHTGKHLVVRESYNIIDPNSISSYVNMVAGTLAKLTNIYEFVGATCIVHSNLEAVEDVYLEYYSAIQPVGIQDSGNKTAYLIMPKMLAYNTPTLVSNVTSGKYYRNAQTLMDVNKIPERAIWFYKESGENTLAYAAGSSLLHGDGINNIRKDNVKVGDYMHTIYKVSDWCKFYPVQNANGKLPKGSHINWLSYFAYFAPNDDVFAYNTFENDVVVQYIHIVNSVSDYSINLGNYRQVQVVEVSDDMQYSFSGGNITVTGNAGAYIAISKIK